MSFYQYDYLKKNVRLEKKGKGTGVNVRKAIRKGKGGGGGGGQKSLKRCKIIFEEPLNRIIIAPAESLAYSECRYAMTHKDKYSKCTV